MHRLTYVLQFHRPPTDDEDAPATAPGLAVTTTLVDGRVRSDLVSAADGDRASLSLTFALDQSGTMFFEWGTLTFGSDGADSVTFASPMAGTLDEQPDDDGFSHGTVTYRVTGGTGALAGCGGAITSNFLVNLRTNELVDTHLGILTLPDRD